MTSSVRILTTSSADSSPAILLVSADGKKILVNCGEGCQRAFLEYSQKLSTVKAVCLTHLGHEATGGLPGLILTTADTSASMVAEEIVKEANSAARATAAIKTESSATDAQPTPEAAPPTLPDLDLIGPQGTQQFVDSLRHFMRREQFHLKVQEGGLRNYRLNVKAKSKAKKKQECTQEGFTIQTFSFYEETVASPHEQGSRKRAHPDRRNAVLSYMFSSPPIPGKFLPDSAAALGVPKGPMYGQLKSGKSVMFIDAEGSEQMVESSQVMEQASPAVSVLILYYPSEEVASQIFESDAFRDEVESSDVFLELVVHIAPKQLFAKFGLPFWKGQDDVEHIFLTTDRKAGDVGGTPFRSAGIEAVERSLLCNEIYQVPNPPSGSDQQVAVNGQKYAVGTVLMEYALIPRPKRGFTESIFLHATSTVQQEAQSIAENSGALALSKDIIINNCDLKNSAGGELIFAGTGAALPSAHRNVTGMLLKQADGRSILLDIGEGTIGQLLRCQSGESEQGLLSSIKAVWISHPHADHHLGLIRLLKDRRAKEPIQLLAPTPIFRFLDEYAAIDASIRDAYYAIDCQYLVHNNHELRARLQDVIGIENCRAVPVTHCAYAYAAIFDGTSFGRVVWSGDCRPSSELAQAAKGADVLIHEATFEDGMQAEAVLKRHSTVGEALGVAVDMEAKCTILTHFSQRYPKIPPTPERNRYQNPIIFAFDYMKLRQSTLVVASELTPALRLLYPDQEDSAVGATTAEIAMSVPGTFANSELL